LANEYPIDVIEIYYNFRRVMATGPGGKMVIVTDAASVSPRENNVITIR